MTKKYRDRNMNNAARRLCYAKQESKNRDSHFITLETCAVLSTTVPEAAGKASQEKDFFIEPVCIFI